MPTDQSLRLEFPLLNGVTVPETTPGGVPSEPDPAQAEPDSAQAPAPTFVQPGETVSGTGAADAQPGNWLQVLALIDNADMNRVEVNFNDSVGVWDAGYVNPQNAPAGVEGAAVLRLRISGAGMSDEPGSVDFGATSNTMSALVSSDGTDQFVWISLEREMPFSVTAEGSSFIMTVQK